MERNPEDMSEEEVENEIPDLMSDFRREGASHGMHKQVMDLAEKYIRRAYRRGREHGKPGPSAS